MAAPLSMTYTQRIPSVAAQVLQKAFDVLDSMGTYSRRISDILQHSFDYSETGTKQNYLAYKQLVQKYFSNKSISNRVNAFREGNIRSVLNHSIHDYGLTTKHRDALIELHELGPKLPQEGPIAEATLKTLVTPKAWESLRAELLDPRVQGLWREGWKIMTGRASSLPSVREHALIKDFVTGESTPVGQPSSFWPHQSIRDETARRLSIATMKQMYEHQGYKAKGISFETFTDNMNKFERTKDETEILRKFAGLEYKRHLDMHADAKSHNRTVAQSLEYYGYETDPLRALIRHNTYALKRSVFLEHAAELTALRQQMSIEYGLHNGSPYHWVENVINRSQGISRREDMFDKSANSWNLAQAIMYPAFLKGSWSQNFLLQPNYAFMVSGFRPIAQAFVKSFAHGLGLKHSELAAMAEQSAANFPSWMAKFHLPDGAFAQYAKMMMTGNWFSFSDRFTRTMSGVFFLPRAENLIRQWWKDPTNPKWQKALEEGNLDVPSLRAKMMASGPETWDAAKMPPIPREYLVRYAKVMTDRAMGRNGIQGLPLWAAGDGQATKLFMMLHRQILSNEGTWIRHIMNAPTAGIGIARGLRFLLGAEAAGTVYQGFVNWTVGNGFFDVNEPLVKSFGNNKEAAFAAKALLLGLGTFTAGILLSGLNFRSGNYGGMTYGLVSPPAAAFIDELAKKVTQGKFLDAMKRVQPSEMADKYLRREQEKERRRRKGGSGLSPERLQ